MRGLAASCAMGTERVIVMHHTDCAMAAHTDAQIRELLPPGPQPEIDFLTIGDPLAALTRDFHAVRSSTLLPDGVEVRAMMFDLETGEASEVEIAASVGDLGEMRRDYRRAEFDEGWLAATWLEQFTLWFDEARASAEIVEPNAMVVATASADARPSARTVLLKALDERGFVFNTNLRSRKGREADENPWGCVVPPGIRSSARRSPRAAWSGSTRRSPTPTLPRAPTAPRSAPTSVASRSRSPAARSWRRRTRSSNRATPPRAKFPAPSTGAACASSRRRSSSGRAAPTAFTTACASGATAMSGGRAPGAVARPASVRRLNV